MVINGIGKGLALTAVFMLGLAACAPRQQAPAEPASNEPGPPPATPVVPVQSEPLDTPDS